MAGDVDDGNEWCDAPAVRTARHALSVTSMSAHRAYAVGGWKYGDKACNSVERFDASGADGVGAGGKGAKGSEGGVGSVGSVGSWVPCAALGTARKQHGLAAWDGALYVFGGLGAGSHAPLKSTERYSEAADAWSAIAPLPVPACCCAVAVSAAHSPQKASGGGRGGGGGCGGSGGSSSGSSSDSSSSSSSGGAGGPGSSSSCGGCHVYILPWGGGAKIRLWRYDPESNTYAKLGPLPLPEWYGFAAAALGQYIYAVGGSSRGRWTGRFWRYDTLEDTWMELEPLRAARRRLALVAVPAM